MSWIWHALSVIQIPTVNKWAKSGLFYSDPYSFSGSIGSEFATPRVGRYSLRGRSKRKDSLEPLNQAEPEPPKRVESEIRIALVRLAEPKHPVTLTPVKLFESEPAKKLTPMKLVESEPVKKLTPVKLVESEPAEKLTPFKLVESEPAKKLTPLKLVESEPAKKLTPVLLVIESEPAKKLTPVKLVEYEHEPAKRVEYLNPVTDVLEPTPNIGELTM